MAEHKYGEVEFERRVFPRFVIHLPFAFEIEGHPQSGEGVTRDASQGGLQVYLSDPVEIGCRLRIKLSLSEGASIQTIEAVARVIWIEETPNHAPKPFKAGLQFLEISEQSMKYLKWFEQLWLNQAG